MTSSIGIESMPQNRFLHNEGLWIRIYILFTVTLFVARVVIFAGHHGGIEHDSGWYLGVAKNLAHRGIYASYTNTIVAEGDGVHPSIHRRFAVQDENGFSYFPAGVTVGPGYVLPQALLLTVFGDGWWQYRLWPLITYTGLLVLLFYIVWLIGSLWSLVILQMWLWAIPQLTTTFAYEAFSEHTALFYLFISFLVYSKSDRKDQAYAYMFLTGFFLGLTVLTKLLFSLTLIVFAYFIMKELLSSQLNMRNVCFRWTCLILGLVFPIFLFEFYRFIALYSHFGVQGWQAINEDFKLTFISQGSGINALGDLRVPFVLEKLRLWTDVGIRPSWLPWLIFLCSPAILMRRVPERYRSLLVLIYGASMVNFVWFVLASPWGWVRHAWHGLVLAMMLVSTVVGISIRSRASRISKEGFIIVLLFLIVIGVSLQTEKTEFKPFLDQETVKKWKVTRRGNRGLPHAPVFSLRDQQDTISFFRAHIRQEDRVYYDGKFLVAEMSTLVDKVFYPLGRFVNNGPQTRAAGSSYLILGPYQKGQWRTVPEGYHQAVIRVFCDSVGFSNQSYTVCKIDEDLKLN